MTPAAARLTASYRALPGHPADGYPAVSKVLLGRLADGFPPAAAARVCTTDGAPYSAAGGWARLADTDLPEPVPADADTLFDLASLTKVVATLPLVLLLHQRGQWSIDDPVARWLPGAPRSPVTISQCLLHVFEANERARRLYAKAGYAPDGSTRVEPEYEAIEVRLVKVLS